MSKTMNRLFLVWCIISCTDLKAISMVYNFRIAQITKQPFTEYTEGKSRTIMILPFDQFRKKYNGLRQNFIGGLGSFIYDIQSYYVRTDFAASYIKQKMGGESFSDVETDDILFTAGRNFAVSNDVSLTLSGLFGIPTHRIFRLQHIDFGYSQIGTGIQLDGSYELNTIRSLLYCARYIYFIPRNAQDPFGIEHKFTIGNVGDILFALKNKWDQHEFECGYTLRLRFGAKIYPNFDDIVKKSNYIRSNFYAVYKYKFLITNIPNRLLFNIAYGFDHKPKVYGNKYIFTLWASWNIAF